MLCCSAEHFVRTTAQGRRRRRNTESRGSYGGGAMAMGVTEEEEEEEAEEAEEEEEEEEAEEEEEEEEEGRTELSVFSSFFSFCVCVSVFFLGNFSENAIARKQQAKHTSPSLSLSVL
jgi:hypothetical protein